MEQASATYQKDLRDEPAAIDYLKKRGISGDSAHYFRLGVVGNPFPGHEKYQSRLAIPYVTPAGVVSIRFRCVPPIAHPGEDKCDHAKILGLPGDMLRVYNVAALHRPSDVIAIAEGEPDTWIGHQIGVPTVGLPGVASMKEYTRRLFAGYQIVYGFVDNDDKGQGSEFAERLATEIPQFRPVLMPPGHDLNSFYLENDCDSRAILDRMEYRV